GAARGGVRPPAAAGRAGGRQAGRLLHDCAAARACAARGASARRARRRSRVRLGKPGEPTRVARGSAARAGRRRDVPDRDQGGGDRRRRRGGGAARGGGGLRRQRGAPPSWRARSRRGAPRARGRRGSRGGCLVTEQRRQDPLPLGLEGDLPYSKGLLARALMATGVTAVRAYELALRVETELNERRGPIDFDRLEELAQEVLGENEGVKAVRRLRRYRELQQLDVPIVLLIGGGTGTGKSTVATEIAYRLGITRVTSTDFIRQTMRAFFSREFMPSIHYSSFEAGEAAVAAD